MESTCSDNISQTETALNYAKVFGMEKAMGLKGNQFSVAASIFYVGYMCGQCCTSNALVSWNLLTVLLVQQHKHHGRT